MQGVQRVNTDLKLDLDVEFPTREMKYKSFFDLLKLVSFDDYLVEINKVRNLTKQGLDNKIKQWANMGDIQDVNRCSYRHILYHLCLKNSVDVNKEDFDFLSKDEVLHRWCFEDRLCLKTKKDKIRMYEYNNKINFYCDYENKHIDIRLSGTNKHLNKVSVCTDIGFYNIFRQTETMDFNEANNRYYNLSLLGRHYTEAKLNGLLG